jgi:predicted N-acetyltransferase YhbS
LVGYITLTTDIIRKEEVRVEGRISVPYKEYPAIKIARLAVDKKYERRGVGRFLLLIAVGKAFDIANEVGCRFITVDSKPDSIGFYKKGGGFELAKGHQDKMYPTMYLDILPIHEKMKAVNAELGDFQSLGI